MLQVDTWYYSPYPEPYNGLDRLFLCEFCLKYFGKRSTLLRHAAKCALRHPPGDEIYRSPPAGPCSVTPAIAMFEVDGNRSKVRLVLGFIDEHLGAFHVCALGSLS